MAFGNIMSATLNAGQKTGLSSKIMDRLASGGRRSMRDNGSDLVSASGRGAIPSDYADPKKAEKATHEAMGATALNVAKFFPPTRIPAMILEHVPGVKKMLGKSIDNSPGMRVANALGGNDPHAKLKTWRAVHQVSNVASVASGKPGAGISTPKLSTPKA